MEYHPDFLISLLDGLREGGYFFDWHRNFNYRVLLANDASGVLARPGG